MSLLLKCTSVVLTTEIFWNCFNHYTTCILRRANSIVVQGMSCVDRSVECLLVPARTCWGRTSLASTGYEVRLNESVIITLNHTNISGYPWYAVLANKAWSLIINWGLPWFGTFPKSIVIAIIWVCRLTDSRNTFPGLQRCTIAYLTAMAKQHSLSNGLTWLDSSGKSYLEWRVVHIDED